MRSALIRTLLAASAIALMSAGQVTAQETPKKAEEPVKPAADAGKGVSTNGAPEAVFNPAVARRLSVDDIKKRMDTGEKIVILDARSAFTGPMAKGAIQLRTDQVATWGKDVPRDAWIVAYCT